MRLRAEDLTRFWAAAADPRPLIVVGAGRWGRVLIDAAAQARGDCRHLALVARQNHDETRAWRDADPSRRLLTVASDISSALDTIATRSPQRGLAIVASRPRDHARDARACLERGLDTLVEKPLTAPPAEGSALLRAAAAADRVLALGVEFSLMPAFHYAADLMGSPVTTARLQWTDHAGEQRHGQRKRAHDEVHALEDNLAHAISIFRIFASADDRFEVTNAEMPRSREAGTVVFASGTTLWTFLVDRDAAARTRHLELRTADGGRLDIDFSGAEGAVSFDGRLRELPPPWAGLPSTVRLEIGAFFEHARTRPRSPLTHDLAEYAELHAALLRVSTAAH